ncbi:MAG: hypothetical protein ACKV2T_35255 [Kofleriaceae bacterium]
MMRAIWIVVLAGCAAAPAPLAANHPAATTAPAGRIAPAPASLRAGVIMYPDVPKPTAKKPGGHHHHDQHP